MQTTFSYLCAELFEPNGACVTLDVLLDVTCRDRDGADAEYVVLNITRSDDSLACIAESDLSERDQRGFEAAAGRAADGVAPDAVREYLEDSADAAFEAWKDRDA